MKKIFLIAFLSLFGMANAQINRQILNSPFHLNHDSSRIILRDYFPNEIPSKLILPPGLKNHSKNPNELILTGEMKSKIALLDVETKGHNQSIILIKSSNKKAVISVKADETFKGEVRIIASFNNWNRASEALILENGYYKAEYLLQAGTYEYKFYVDGQELNDPLNPKKVSNGMGGFNNIIKIEYAESSLPHSYFLQKCDSSWLYISEIPKEQELIALWENEKLKVYRKKDGSIGLQIPAKAQSHKRSFIRCFSYLGERESNDLLIPLEYGKVLQKAENLERFDWHSARLYFLMIDRFKNGNLKNDKPTPDPEIHPKANYYGGDLAGLNQAVDDGFFNDLYVNTIWLSPITQNPWDAWGYWDKGMVKSKFSAYHGYWPISNVQIDKRFGSPEELNALLLSIHKNENNALLDYVANHVHINHPVYQKNKDWATPLFLEDGTKNTEKWDEHRLTTWFDDHLPTLDLREKEIVDAMVDSAVFWLSEYSFDGFRHDATKHIDELYWRTLTYKLKSTLPEKAIYQIGETYGSPQLINSYISTGMLDAQFDFNLYDAAVDAFAKEETSLDNLKDKLKQGLETYGYHHLMGNITGNQDRSRFISLASGNVKFEEDQKLAGWDRQIPKPNAEAYKRLGLLHAFNNAIPGLPCIYYGDEYGLPGGGDPDNRRMMEFNGYDNDELALRNKVVELTKLRSTQLALIYGSTSVEIKEQKVLLIRRKYLDQEVIIVINKSKEPIALEIENPDKKVYHSSFSNKTKSINENLSLELEALSFEYLIYNPN